MKSFFLVFLTAFTLFSCSDVQVKSPEETLAKALDTLNNWQTLSYAVATTKAGRTLTTTYKLKKVLYEPYIRLFFYKEMNGNIGVYHKLNSLAVVEDKKKKISIFDVGNDRSVPKYLELYMADNNNLINLTGYLNSKKNEIQFVEEEKVDGEKTYSYTFGNYKLWLDVNSSLPVKYEIAANTSKLISISLKNIIFDSRMTDEVFTHPQKEGYVTSMVGAKTEPLLNTMAKDWELKDLEGSSITLNDFKGKPLFLEAWISTCDHCAASMPAVKKIASNFSSKLNVVTVNFDYDLPSAKAAVKEHAIEYQVLQGDALFDKNYDLRSFPSYFVINSAGKIVYSERGTIEGRKQKVLLEALNSVE